MNYDYAKRVRIHVPVNRHGEWSKDECEAHHIGTIVKKHQSGNIIVKLMYFRLYNGRFLQRGHGWNKRTFSYDDPISGIYLAMSELPMRLREAMENRRILDIEHIVSVEGAEW